MADGNPRVPSTPDYRELGISGTRLFSGLVQDETVPQLQGMNAFKTYTGMRNDATCSALYKAIELPIRSARWFVNPANDDPKNVEMADFAHDQFWEFGSQSMDDVLRLGLGSLPFGFAVLENIWKLIDEGQWKGKVGLDSLAWRSQSSKWRWNMDYIDDRRQLVSMTQLAPPFYEQVEIPRSKFLLFVHDLEGDNYDGMELDLDTPIPTPDGWTTMRDLRVGDRVYDEHGIPRNVVAKSDVHRDLQCYEVVFNSGESIVTSADHHWFARNYQDRKHQKPGRTVTTEEMASSLKYRRTVGLVGRVAAGTEPARDGRATNNWSVTASEPLWSDEVPLPFEPYVLGYWLGDGATGATMVAYDPRDPAELAAHFRASGFEVTIHRSQMRLLARPKWSRNSVRRGLMEAGVLDDKHIPPVYFRASQSQRLALLQGLMDADGAVVKGNGLCVFTNTNRRLVDGVAELASSLGCCSMSMRTQAPSKAHAVNGQTVNGRHSTWQLTFSLPLPAFRLSRKLAGQNLNPQRARRDHYIVDIRPVATRPVQCITVDSPSHLYLAGRRMIPTHNSLFRPGWKDYFIRDRLYRIRAIGLERGYMGIPKVTLPAGFSDEMKALGQQIVETIRVDEQAGILHPEEILVEVLHNSLQEGAMDKAILFHNRQILLSQLGQFLDLGSGQAGAYSLSSDHSELFLYAVTAKANYVAQTINQDPGIPPLIRWNWGNVDSIDMPRLEHGDIGQRALERIGRTIAALGQWGFLTPDDETEDRFREMLDLPERGEAVTDRALYDLVQQVFPIAPEYGRSHTQPREVAPGLSTGAASAMGVGPTAAPPGASGGSTGSGAGPGRQVPGQTNQQAMTNAQADMAEHIRMSEARQKLSEVLVRRRWDRPVGRPTEETRRAMAATSAFAEALDDVYSGRGRKPMRPSETIARNRRPYEIQAAERKPSTAQKLEGRPRTVITRQMATAKRHSRELQALLRPRVAIGPPPAEVSE